jgi:hypothetical protein
MPYNIPDMPTNTKYAKYHCQEENPGINTMALTVMNELQDLHYDVPDMSSIILQTSFL